MVTAMRMIESRVRVNILAIALSLLVSACAATTPPQQISAEDLARIRQGPPITAVVYQPPPQFLHSTAFTTGLVMVPIVGGVAEMQAVSEAGAQTTRGIELVNPSIRVRDKFVEGIASELGVPQPTVRNDVNLADIEHLRTAIGSGLVLEFRTVSWGIGTYRANPFRQDRFQVNINVRARLINPGEQKIIWEYVHGVFSRDTATVQQLQQNDGTLLKRWLAEASDRCATDLVAKFSARGKPQ